jgi:hypothetical protein
VRIDRMATRLALAFAAVAMLGGAALPCATLAAPALADGFTGPDIALAGAGVAPSPGYGEVRAAESAGGGVTVARARIGLQVGHWQAAQSPAPFNTQLGASGGGKSESEVNLAIAEAAAAKLRAAGQVVDLLPTVIPAGYQADLVVAVHADGGASSARGFFVDHSTRSATGAAEANLAAALTGAYESSGIPNVDRSTVNSRRYYGYLSVSPTTPMVLIETGFLTSALDRQVLVDQPALAGEAIANGILSYLDARR